MVDYSKWAALIVAAPKNDGNICICGDYKVAINPMLEVGLHLLPLPEELFPSLSGLEVHHIRSFPGISDFA